MHAVRAGKFRRYHGTGLKQLLDLPTIALNIRDGFRVVAGFFESRKLLRRLKPEIIFIKGGFVGVPVGLAAASKRIPFVTHDSDSIPGLANRIISRWAAMYAVGMPKELYPYPAEKTRYVGVPISGNYKPVSGAEQRKLKESLGVAADAPLLLVTGGGLGAERINKAVIRELPALLDAVPDLKVCVLTGRGKDQAFVRAVQEVIPDAAQRSGVLVKDFVNDLYRYSGAADVVVARAGATALAELAAQAKACVVIPSPYLTGGHQLKNAQFLADQQAIQLLTEEMMAREGELSSAVVELMKNRQQREQLGQALHRFARPDAAKELAEMLLEAR